MMTVTRTRRAEQGTDHGTDAARTDGRTAHGTALQVAWAGFVVYSLVMSAVQTDHPEPPGWLLPILEVTSLAIFATAGGLLVRRRWALWGSAALALPVAGMAVFCVLADAGFHWVAEVAFAVAIVGLTLHPASWRMHAR